MGPARHRSLLPVNTVTAAITTTTILEPTSLKEMENTHHLKPEFYTFPLELSSDFFYTRSSLWKMTTYGTLMPRY